MLTAWWLGYGNDPRTGYVLAWGIFAAGILQLILLLDGARRNGLMPRFTRPKMTPGVRQLVTLGIPGVIAGGVTQINIVIGSMIASLHTGAVSYLFYADRLYELPLALVGIAIGVVLLPDVSRHLRAGDQVAVMDSQNRALELAMLLTLPAAVALAVIPTEIISVLYQRGAFSSTDTANVAAALAFFALGLPSFVLIKVFSPAFFAREDTKTPMRFASISMALNTLGSIGLFFLFRDLGWMPHVGIAIATAFGGWLNAGLLWWALRRNGHFVADTRLKRALAMIVLSSAVMGGALWWHARELAPWFATQHGTWTRALALLVLISGGGLVYAIAAFGTGAVRSNALVAMFRRKR
jgi:putative peptidoglycan lipid II flippase